MNEHRKSDFNVEGWSIAFWANIHMYCHRLIVRNGDKEYELQCEDLPVRGNFIGIWLYATRMPESHRKELIHILVKWADQNKKRLKIYTEREVSHVTMGDGRIRTERTSPTGESLSASKL